MVNIWLNTLLGWPYYYIVWRRPGDAVWPIQNDYDCGYDVAGQRAPYAKNKSDGKRRNTLSCLDQYTCNM